VAQLHTDVVMLLIGLSAGTWFALRLSGAPAGPRAAAGWLLGAEAAQGVIGYAQYFSHLPVLLVAGHMLGACLVWICAVRLLLAMRSRPAATDPAGEAGAGAAGDARIDAVGVGRAGAGPAGVDPAGADPAEGDQAEVGPAAVGAGRPADVP
jgi:cytochrome c oxidase assembly protein subunit 15